MHRSARETSLGLLCTAVLARHSEAWWNESEGREVWEAIVNVLTAEQKGLLLEGCVRKGADVGRNLCLAAALVVGALELRLNGCAGVGDVVFSIIAQPECSQGGLGVTLEALDLSDCPISAAALQGATPHLLRLSSLCLSRSLLQQRASTEQAVQALATLTQLTHLDLSFSPCLTDASVSAIFSKLPRLESLRIAGCPDMTDDAFTTPLTSPHLSFLDLSGNKGLTPAAMCALGVSVRRLALRCRSLLLTGTGINVDSVLGLDLERLTRLEVAECECTGNDLEMLARAAPALEALDLSWCEGVTDQGIQTLCRSCTQLTCLNLRKLHIFDTALLAMPHAARLRRVRLARCDAVTDVGLEALCKGCPLVEDLDLSWLTELSHQGLLTFLPTLTRMQKLNLEGLKPICDSHLESFGSRMLSLCHLKLTWCNAPTDSDIDALLARSKCRLMVLDYYGNARSLSADGVGLTLSWPH